jgi:hypothetical protein
MSPSGSAVRYAGWAAASSPEINNSIYLLTYLSCHSSFYCDVPTMGVSIDTSPAILYFTRGGSNRKKKFKGDKAYNSRQF